MLFDACDLDLDPLTLLLKLDTDMVVTYIDAKTEVNRSNGLKVTVWKCIYTVRQTDMCKTFTYQLQTYILCTEFFSDR